MAPFFILSSKKMRIGNFLLVPLAGALLYTLMALLRAAACRRDAELADEAPVFARRARWGAAMSVAALALYALWRWAFTGG